VLLVDFFRPKWLEAGDVPFDVEKTVADVADY
jgi:hypothetical protein